MNDLNAYAEHIVQEFSIPGISLAIWHNNELRQGASGLLNLETRVKATPDSVFQVGSITKVVTASIIMRLIDQGHLLLDAPVKRYLKDFRVADPYVTENVTVRQLLNHTSGLAGDFFPDDPPSGGNAISRFLDRCCLLPQAHALGKHCSYSNAAYAIAGRLIEVVMGTSWFNAVEEEFIKPLGLTHSFANPLQAIRFRTAIGHVPDPNTSQSGNNWILTPKCYLPIGQAAAGATLSMSVADLITFAKAHLNQGLTDSGERWLSADSVREMQASNISLPTHAAGTITDWGVGWFLTKAEDLSIIGHDGATFGQLAALRLVPEHNLAFAALINSDTAGLTRTIFNELMMTLTNTTIELPKPTGEFKTPQKLTGVYDCFDSTLRITCDRGELKATITEKVDLRPPTTVTLKAINDQSAIAIGENGQPYATLHFLELDQNGVPGYLHFRIRIHRRL